MNFKSILFSVVALVAFSSAEAADGLTMKSADLRGVIADFRWRFFDEAMIGRLSEKRMVLIDDTGMLEGGVLEMAVGEGSARDVIVELYRTRGRTFRTVHFVVVVQRAQILKIRFRSFEELPSDLVLMPGDVLLLYEIS